jgi:RHS repeat-associated protein
LRSIEGEVRPHKSAGQKQVIKLLRGRHRQFGVAMFVSFALVVLLPIAVASATVLPEKFTENTTLTPAKNPYTGASTIESGVTVKAEPGIKFAETGLVVKGTLLAEGTSGAPIVFEGNGLTAVTFEPESGASVLNHVEVLHAGTTACCTSNPAILVKKSSPTIENSTIAKSPYLSIYVKEGGSPEIANNHIVNDSRTAIFYSASTGNMGEVNIHGNVVESSYGGISVNATGSSVTGKTLSANTVSGTELEPLKYTGPDIPGDVTENTLSGNKTNEIEVSGTVAHSATWNNGGTKVKLIGATTVASGATLRIEPGVRFSESNLVVNGTLLAEGTSSEPVIFEGGSQAAVAFEPGSGASVLNHVEVLHAGTTACCTSNPAILVKKSSPTIENSTIAKSPYLSIYVKEGGSPEIANNHIVNDSRTAIFYSASTGNMGEVNIHGNVVESSYGGISVNATGSSVTGKTLSANTVSGTELEPLKYTGPDIPGDVTENTLSGNKTNEIEVSGSVGHSSTWKYGGTPVKLIGGTTVVAGATLRIEPGVRLLETNLVVNGTLLAEGNAVNPVVFEGGLQAAVTFEPGSGASVLSYVQVLKAGKEACCGANRPAIWIKRSSPRIVNSTIANSPNYSIWIPEGGSPEIAEDLIANGARAAILYSASTGKSGEVNIHGNVIEGTNAGIIVNATGSTVTGKALSGNLVTGTSQEPISYTGPDIPSDITDNTLVANKSNLIEVAGTLAHSSTWKNTGVPVRLSGTVTIVSGATLNIAAGVALLNPAMIVKGTLEAHGTQEQPVLLTGLKQETLGEWGSIVFEPGSGESVLDHAEVSYGGQAASSGMIEAKGSHPTVTNSTIRKAKYYGIKVTESGTPRIEWNRFRANASGGLSYSGTGTLKAPNNDWGCASGPKPAGCGDSVTSNVEWKPAVQLPELDGPCRGKESQCGEGADPVSLATGHLDYPHRDLLLTNKSAVPLEFTRTYDSGSAEDTGLGTGWSQSGLASVTELEGGASVMVLRQDGRQDLFRKTESGYQAPSGVTDALAKVEGTFQLTTLGGTVYRFDSSGRIASITDDHGLKTTYGYDANGRLATITDPSGQTLTFAYNASNHISSVKDSTGREVKFAYSAAGDLESVTDPLGGITKYAYDSQHRITQITDPRGKVILKNTYDPQGRITEQRDGLEDLWKLEYKASETIVTEPQGGRRTYGFDSQNRVISETDQLGHTTGISYDSAGNVSEVIEPGGAEWSFGHDAAGNVTSAKDPEGGERSYEYDSKNRLTHSTDARGDSWSYEWSAANDLTKVTDPEGGETVLTYNTSGQPLTATDPDKHKSEFSYDTRGNRLSATDPLGHKTSFEYNSRNYLTAKTLPGLKAETLERDALGDLLARTTPEGHKTKYAYDANGLPTQVTDPAEGIWRIERNAMERPTVYVDPLGQEMKVSYNGNLKPTKVVNRRGKETTYAYNLANQLTEVARPEGGVWKYGYDSRGNRTSMVEPRGNETTYAYDLLDRMTGAKEPLSVTTKYGYDANGDLTAVTDPRGNATSYAYDRLGRLTEIAQPLEEKTTYTYDAAGNELTKTTGVGALEYGYDAANRLTQVKAGEATLRSYGYDAANRLTEASDAEGHKIEVGYTEEGRPSSIKDGRGQSLTRSYDSRGNLVKQVDGRGTIEYGYDKLDRMTSLTDPQGKALGFAYDPEGDLTEVTRPNGITTTNVYNEAGRLAETSSKTAEPLAVLESLKYGYDAAGNVTSKVDQRLESETGYAYDALNRLTEFNPPGEGSTTYGYDGAGNRTEAGGTTYSFNALNQLTESSAGTTYSYDGAGRLTGEVNGAEETTFGWDPFDHLAKAETSGGTVTYAFDGLERLSERKSGEATRVFHYGDLGDMPTYETDGEGKTTTSYVQGPRGLVEQRSGEATSFPLLDSHGDVTAIAGGGGEVESRQSFDPWGNQLSGPSVEMGYLGAWERPSDPTSGMIQMGARSYDPALGAFASEDPVLGHLGIGISANRYPYAWDNPLSRYDLQGRDVLESLEDLPEEFEEGWEQVERGASQVASSSASAAESAWNWTAPSRQWVSDRAQDFWKHYGGTLTDIYNFVGANWQTCLEGGSAGAAIGFYGGTAVFPVIGSGAGAAGGGALGCTGLVGARLGVSAMGE